MTDEVRDTGFTEETVVDPAYDLHQGFEQQDEAERQLGFDPVPRFDYYHVKFSGAKGQISSQKGSPGFFATSIILHGPAGTEGRPLSDAFYLSISPTKNVKSGGKVAQIQRTAEEVAKAKGEMQATVKRIGTRLSFMSMLPDAPIKNQENLDKYAAQFAGKEAIIAAGIDRSSDAPKNRIQWRSIAAPGDPVKDKKTGEVLGTALEQALEKIKKFDEKTVAGQAGRTSGSFVGAPGGFASV